MEDLRRLQLKELEILERFKMICENQPYLLSYFYNRIYIGSVQR